jgi:membrane protease YdiL (CAAX protease family)
VRTYGSGRLAAWLVVVGALATFNYAARFAGGDGSSDRDALYHYSTAISAFIFYGLLFVVIYTIASIDIPELFAIRQPRSWWRALGLALAILVGIFILAGIVSLLPLPQSPSDEQGLTPTHWQSRYAAPYALNAIAIAVVAPIVEELTFRGVGYRLLLPFGRWLSILAVGLAFGLAHGLVEGLLLLVPFGVALAWLRSRADSVVPCMITHSVFNGIALLAVLGN